jgi:hypothetical protein
LATYERYALPWPPALGGGHRDLDDLSRQLTRVGFSAISRVPVEVEAIYPSADLWWSAKWTHGARRPLESMPPAILQAFVAEVNARMEPLRQPDGFHERWRVVCLLATKPVTHAP